MLITETITKYYFLSEQQNNQYIILPLFMKSKFSAIIYAFYSSLLSIIGALTHLFTMVKVSTNYAIETVTKNNIVVCIFERVKPNSPFEFEFTDIDKIMLLLLSVYLFTKMLYDFWNTN
jgi:hypothetical protein